MEPQVIHILQIRNSNVSVIFVAPQSNAAVVNQELPIDFDN
jgi:hypothetical protein